MTLERTLGKHLRMLTSNLVREFKANKKFALGKDKKNLSLTKIFT